MMFVILLIYCYTCTLTVLYRFYIFVFCGYDLYYITNNAIVIICSKTLTNKHSVTYNESELILLTTVELQWLEHLWNHENMFETGVVRANEW